MGTIDPTRFDSEHTSNLVRPFWQRRKLQECFESVRALGYTVEQVNGCRVMTLILNSTISQPERGCEIFITNIPEDVAEDEVFPLFSSVGTIYELRFMVSFSGASKGFCYVQYLTPELCSIAIKTLNGYEIRPDTYLTVKKSRDNCRLFFGKIPKEIPRETVESEFKQLLERYQCIKIFIYVDPDNKLKNRGFIFAEFKTHRDTALARRALARRLFLWGSCITVDWASHEVEVDESLLPLVSRFLHILSNSITCLFD